MRWGPLLACVVMVTVPATAFASAPATEAENPVSTVVETPANTTQAQPGVQDTPATAVLVPVALLAATVIAAVAASRYD